MRTRLFGQTPPEAWREHAAGSSVVARGDEFMVDGWLGFDPL